jgi:predicted RNA binding protein YcfA (HicA-like mRNA interferase family)
MMKRRDLLKQIERLAKEAGETVETREGGSHTVVKFGDKQTVVPRHAEINEITAKKILKQLGD